MQSRFFASLRMTAQKLLFIRHALLPCPRLAGLQPRADESMYVTVHHALHVGGLVAGAQVFDHLVRLEHVTADLVAPRHGALLTVILFHRGALLILLLLIETR